MGTGIGWTDETWNPTTGCDRVSPGCDNCYALTQAPRLQAMNAFLGKAAYQRDGDPRTSGPGFGLMTYPDRLDQPLRWKRPRRIFVNSMSDLFHAEVPDEFIARVFAVMALAPRHTFQILTKRHGRMRSLLGSTTFRAAVLREYDTLGGNDVDEQTIRTRALLAWPLPNVHLGVSVEDQQRANLRVPALLDTPAAVRFLSCEPLLGPVDLAKTMARYRPADGAPWDGDRLHVRDVLHWVIAGGESGAGARPMNPHWVRRLRDQCADAGVPFFFKQWGAYAPIAPADARPTDVIITPAGLVLPWAERDDLTPEAARRSWALRKGSPRANGNVLDGAVHEAFPTTLQEAPA